MSYALGTDLGYITDKSVVRFWDVDGVLCVYGFGLNGVNACDDSCFQEYMKEHNIYAEAKPIPFVQEFMEKYTLSAHNYVVSKVYSEYEKECKKDFVNTHYHDWISENNIFFVMGNDKTRVMRQILNTRYFGVYNTKHCIIDDTVEVLSTVQKEGLCGIHVSSLMLLSKLM